MIDKEMASNDISVLHHLGIISRDMGAVIEQYECLGFTFAPLTLPRIPLKADGEPKPIGVGNRCAITEVIVCVADPDRVAAKYQAYAGQCIQRRGNIRMIDLGLSRILVVAADHVQDVLPGNTAPMLPFLAGFTVSADLSLVREVLMERQVGFQTHDGRILVNASNGYGACVLFESADGHR
jgi:hypothetical protein